MFMGNTILTNIRLTMRIDFSAQCKLAQRVLPVILLINAVSVHAGEVIPYINVSEFYTDNLFLQTEDKAKSDWVTQLRPGVTFNHESSRFKTNVDYSYQALLYKDNSEFNGSFNQLDSFVQVELVDDQLFLWGQALIEQVNVSPEEPLSTSNIPVTFNRSDRTTFYLGPQWKRTVGPGLEIDVRAYGGRINFDDSELQDITARSLQAVLRTANDNPAKLGYELYYEIYNLDYAISGDIEDQRISFELNYDLLTHFSLLGVAGMESNLAKIDDSSLSEPFWMAGFEALSRGNILAASVGRRYFGTTYYVSLNSQTSIVTYGFSYREEPTNSDALPLLELPNQPPIPGQPPKPPDPDPNLDRPGSADRFLNKRMNASVGWEGNKNTITFFFFSNRRESLEQIDTGEKSYGFGTRYYYATGQRSGFGLLGSWDRRESIATNPDDPDAEPLRGNDILLHLQMYYDYALGLKTRVRAEGRWDSRNVDNSTFQNFDAFLAMVGLTRDF